MKQNTILLAATLLLATAVNAQRYVLTELPTQSQLPVANVHAILQDREGYMWYATQDGGLCRDNGYHIDVFRADKYHPELIGNNNIADLAEDHDNHIIFGCRNGLYLLDKRDYTIRLVDEEVKVEDVAPNELDRKFLTDAMAAVEKNLDNDAYDIDAFASDIFMSRSTVYRKLVSLTGQKPSEFIRTIRLKHAARLIKEGKYTLTDIGYMCGFSSVSYFYRCFKKQYGVNPGNYE